MNQKPQCFVVAPPGNLQSSTALTIIISHLRPNGSDNKIVTTVIYNTQRQSYEIENGNVNNLSVIAPYNYYGAMQLYFAYLRNGSIAYRRIEFGNNNGTIYRELTSDTNLNISSGDGYNSRYTPDISLMGGVPVVTYAASYNATRLVEFENNETEYIPVSRYPIVKVHRITTGMWSNFVIYNSNNVQSNPDIEGSKDTKSYIINYSLNNGQFKKVANAYNHPGYFCQPSLFTGTDSRLISNSYSGSLGSNLSLLTLSPQNDLFKLDKQNFSITNLVASESFDIENIDGVVNLDTIKYSFKLGPIFIQDIMGGLEGSTFGSGSEAEEPILNSVDFNENLKSAPFILNEEDALLLGTTANYVKDNSYYSIMEIPYTVKLYNKRTDTLHRILFRDTIHTMDSVETELLRGFFITDIPNDEDSFYVKLEIDNTFDEADYFINPIYEDEYDTEGDNLSHGKLAVIFENHSSSSSQINIPDEYLLLQNFPNPFNPSTTIKYNITTPGLVSLKIYDNVGKEILTLVSTFQNAGSYLTKFDGSTYSSGVYYYRIECNDFIETRKMLLLK